MTISTNKKIRWAIVGLGLQAEKIAAAIQNSKNNELVAVASKDDSRAKKFARRFGIKFYFDSYSKMLKQKLVNIDTVFIVSANFEHAKQSLLALKYKKHVLCEKPMALSLKEGIRIKEVAEKNKMRFGIGFHLRFHPPLREAKKIIDSGQLGKISLIEMHWSIGQPGETKFTPLSLYRRWRENPKKSGGGALMARGVHLLDLLNFLLGQKIKNVSAFCNNKSKNQVEQLTTGIVRLDDSLAILTTGRQLPFALNHITIYGSHGRLFVPEPFNTNGTGDLKLKTKKGEILKKFGKKIDLYQKEIENFSDSILENKTWSGANIDDGIKTVVMSEKWFKETHKASTRPQ